MTNLLLVYITCESVKQAKKIGRHLMKKRLCACVIAIPTTHVSQKYYNWLIGELNKPAK